jgi:hypothetical protein
MQFPNNFGKLNSYTQVDISEDGVITVEVPQDKGEHGKAIAEAINNNQLTICENGTILRAGENFGYLSARDRERDVSHFDLNTMKTVCKKVKIPTIDAWIKIPIQEDLEIQNVGLYANGEQKILFVWSQNPARVSKKASKSTSNKEESKDEFDNLTDDVQS